MKIVLYFITCHTDIYIYSNYTYKVLLKSTWKNGDIPKQIFSHIMRSKT